MGVEQLTGSLYRLLLGPFQAYLWREPDGVTLIDTGAADAGADIALALDELGLAPTDITRVVLTHFHDDHSGAAAEIREWAGAEVIAHAADVPYLTGERPGPAPKVTDDERALLERLERDVPPAPPVTVDRIVTDGDVLPFGDGARVIATPGHTDGSIALCLPEHRLLFTGDTVAENLGRVILGPFNLDTALAVQSMRRLGELDLESAVFGHGQPVLHGAGALLRQAVAAVNA
jgi:glyoxylase-like metal-dependent hydrolase (beta-lactamase superfamily II)